jgi:WXG100 family type VII secretion target
MTRYEYDLDEMQAVEDILRKYHETVNDKLQEIDSIVSRIRGKWDSEAAAAYEARHADWVKQSQLMGEQLADIDQWLNTARTVYALVMKTNTSMFVQS